MKKHDDELSEDILDSLADDEENKENYILFLFGVNPIQAGLLTRVLKTLKIEASWAKVTGDWEMADSDERTV